MKLFSLPDGTVDRKDRAQWFTMPFDLAFDAPSLTTFIPVTMSHLEGTRIGSRHLEGVRIGSRHLEGNKI